MSPVHTRMGLIENDLSLTLAHPIEKMAQEAIAGMRVDLTGGAPLGKRIIGFDIYTPENI